MKKYFLSTTILALFCGVLSVWAMPPHPDLMSRIASGQCEVPYALEHRAEALGLGVDAPYLIPFMHNLAQRHSLDQNLNALVLMVDFPDKPHQVPTGGFDSLFSNTGHLSSFLSEITYGTIHLFVVRPSAGWLRMPQNYSYYVNNQNGMGAYPHNSQKMVADAVAAADLAGLDFSQFDNDGDGYVDALFVLHAGRGAEYTGNNSDIWSHAWATLAPVSVDGVSVSHYSTEPEYWVTPGDMTHGVFAHEMGHAVFGLPDLYDTDNNSQGIGNWSLMSGGSWNGTLGNSPAHPDAWCKIQMGLVTPTSVTTTRIGASIPAVETSPTVFRLGDAGNEYFLVENRQHTGSDATLPGSGLLIYHIDDALYSNTNQWYPGHTTSGHYWVAVEQADGLWEMEHNLNRGNAGDSYPGSTDNHTFSDASTPNSKNYAGAATGVAVQNISASAATMTADLYGATSHALFVTKPDGGEAWYVGEVDTIRWYTLNVTGNVKIEVNYAYPSSAWNTIVASAPNTGSYRWVVTPGISTASRIRITSASFPSASDTSNANFTLDDRTITISAPGTGVTWIAGDVDSIKWTSQNLAAYENVKIEINRAYPGSTWSTVAATYPNSGSFGWTVTGSAATAARVRITGVQHPSATDTSETFSVATRTIALTSPNTALTWIVGDSSGIRWTSQNMSENVKIELKRVYPSGDWETLAASVPNNGSYNFLVTAPTSTTARVRVAGLTHPGVGDTSSVNFSIAQRSVHVTFANTAKTCLIGDVDSIRWTSTSMTGENVVIEYNRDWTHCAWDTLAASAPNTGLYRWSVAGPATVSGRVRVSAALHPSVADTCDAWITLVVPVLNLGTPNSGATWYVGDSDTIRWWTQNVTENVKIEINRSYPAGTWTTLAASAPNTGWYRWVVAGAAATASRIRVSAVSHAFISDTSASLAIDTRSLSVYAPTTALTWVVGDTMMIQWGTRNLPDAAVKIEVNRAYSSGAWSTLAASAPNSGLYAWVVNGPASTAARVRISGTVHTGTSGMSAVNFTIAARRITVTSPNTAVSWNVGSVHAITWTSAYMDLDNLKIELKRVYPGGAWETIADDVPNTGGYSWTISGATSNIARVRITGKTHTSVGDTSNTSFIIHVASSPPGPLSVDDGSPTPTEFALEQNYPNPFNATTEILYDLPRATHVELKVFDMLGREITTLVDQALPAGRFRVMWNGWNTAGGFSGSGNYLYRITAGDFTETRKMILLK